MICHQYVNRQIKKVINLSKKAMKNRWTTFALRQVSQKGYIKRCCSFYIYTSLLSWHPTFQSGKVKYQAEYPIFEAKLNCYSQDMPICYC